ALYATILSAETNMAIKKKSLTGATSANVKQGGGSRSKKDAKPAETPKLIAAKKLAMTKLATAKLSTARLAFKPPHK
ncbi:MAG: hypothetical protein WA510_09925, partial [Acidobacteriaceae bacterium]